MTEEQTFQERPHRHGARGISGAVILIGLGVAFLLNNLGVIDFQWWALWRLWPIFLILIGLDIVLGRSTIGSIVAALIGLVVVVGMIYWVGTTSSPAAMPSGQTITRDIEQIELGDVDRLEAYIEIGAASATVEGLSDSRYVVEGSYTTDENLDLLVEYDRHGSRGDLSISQGGPDFWFPTGPGYIGELDLRITESVPVDLKVDTGVGSLNMDLSGVDLESLKVDGGAGEVVIVLPDEGAFEVDVNAGVGRVELAVPGSQEARIEIDGGLTSVNLSERFQKVDDDKWETRGFTESSGLIISIDSGVGEIQIHE
ncbi:MAG: hypothetical protein JXJ17_13935 [Anaerolineae bacterium]|nr:hypothetical protein [Anaerolineae bacterium]